MPTNLPIQDEDEDYQSSQDSDFNPDDAARPESESSDSEDELARDQGESRHDDNTRSQEAEDYRNSGDEAVIKKGRKRQKLAKNKVRVEELEEGGLIKTRRQRAAEKDEERKYSTNADRVTVDVDAIWAEMMAGNSEAPGPDAIMGDGKATNGDDPHGTQTDGHHGVGPGAAGDQGNDKDNSESPLIRIQRTYNFAGRVHTEAKLVPRDSAEAKLYLASQTDDASQNAPLTKNPTRKAFRSAFEPAIDGVTGRTDLNLGLAARMKAAKEAQAKKLNTVEKSRMDWAGYVDKEGIKDELELAGKSKDSYAARQSFLARSEALRDYEAQKARLAGQSVRL